MSDFIVTARKWRPMRFDEVVGQDHVTVTLRNALEHKRIAHAYLFSGPRGVGKTTTARLLAKAVNCLSPVDWNPDNTCELCREITEGRSFNVLEIDGASNRGVDEIRSLRESVRFPPAKGAYKTYIIDEVHMLTKEAFNALLKTLEEPPRHVLFILATTEIHKVPSTILSRCQRFEFRRLSTAEIAGNLRKIAATDGVEIDQDALLLIARKADGSLRDAQSLFDQMISLCGKTITHEQIQRELRIVDQEINFRATEAIRRNDGRAALELVEGVVHQGYDLKEFLEGFIEHLRNILVVKTTGSTELVEASDAYRKRYESEAEGFSVADILRLERLASETVSSIRWSTQPRFKVEADLVQMTRMAKAENVEDLIQRIDALKKKVVDGGMNATPPKSAGGPAKSAPVVMTPTVGNPQEHRQPFRILSVDELPGAWDQLVKEMKKKRISLGMTLESARVLGVQANQIRVGVQDDFAISSLKRYKVELQEILGGILGTRVQLEPQQDPEASRPKGPSMPQVENLNAQPEEHPVVKALIRELGAEPL
jgi:DNA polymerase-3 subunit gamma/tau